MANIYSLMERYNPREVEKKWQRIWEEEKAFQAAEGKPNKRYILEMFPYPSGNIHMGHVRNYTIGDAIARYLKMRGANIFHPMGWDAFGLPAENAAIKHEIHPAEWTYKNIENMRRQLKLLGLSYDWGREIATCDPEYYKWNQWIFLKLLERGIAYRKSAVVNWCPSCETVLANEQVIEGRCWRCDTPVVQKEIPSWYLKITAYADRLLEDLKKLEGKWPDRVIAQQRNWIGRSEGAKIKFKVEGLKEEIVVFTTRPDTLFGVTFIALAPEHPLTLKLAEGTPWEEAVKSFVEKVKSMPVEERRKVKEKEGVFTGRYAVHPLTGELIPIWVANYVLVEYGTGAIMAVPAHDERDYEFARKYGLPIREVIKPQSEV